MYQCRLLLFQVADLCDMQPTPANMLRPVRKVRVRSTRGQAQLRSQRISNLPLAHLRSPPLASLPTRLPGDAERPKEGARGRAGGRRVRVGCDGRLCERYDEYEVGQDRQVCCHGEVGGDSEVGREAKLRGVEQVGRVRGRVRDVQQESLKEQWEAGSRRLCQLSGGVRRMPPPPNVLGALETWSTFSHTPHFSVRCRLLC